MAFSGSQVTRLGIGGGIWRAYGDFSGKTEQVIEEVIQEQATGGFWFAWEQERYRQADLKRELQRKKKKAKKIKDDLERQLAIEERKLEEEEIKKQELVELTKIVERYQDEITDLNELITDTFKKAVERRTFSAMEKLKREVEEIRQEEQFILQAAEYFLQ